VRRNDRAALVSGAVSDRLGVKKTLLLAPRSPPTALSHRRPLSALALLLLTLPPPSSHFPPCSPCLRHGSAADAQRLPRRIILVVDCFAFAATGFAWSALRRLPLCFALPSRIAPVVMAQRYYSNSTSAEGLIGCSTYRAL
jgi:hypothetical protein